MATLLAPSPSVAPQSLTVDGVLAHIKQLAARIHDDIPLVTMVARDQKVWMWDDSDDESIIINPRAIAKLHEQGYLPEEVKPLPTPRGPVVYMLKDEFSTIQERLTPKRPFPKWEPIKATVDDWTTMSRLKFLNKYVGKKNDAATRKDIQVDIEDHYRRAFLAEHEFPMMFVDPPYLMSGPEPTEDHRVGMRELFRELAATYHRLGRPKLVTVNEFYRQQESKPDLFYSEVAPITMYVPPAEPTEISFKVLKNRDPAVETTFRHHYDGSHSMGAMVHKDECVLCRAEANKKP